MPSGIRRKTKIVDGVQYNQCTKCGEWFPATNEYFDYRNKAKNYLQAICKNCLHSYGRKYYQENKERVLAHNKKYRDAHREKVAAGKRKYKENV